jgi:integrase
MTKNELVEAPMAHKKARAKAAKKTFTKLSLYKLRLPKDGQRLYWDGGDKGQLGLSVLVSAGGTKTYRSTFYLHGTRYDRKLGRVGEMDLSVARELTREDRKQAAQGIDPRIPQHAEITFAQVVDKFIEQYAKPRQRTWDQTANTLRNNCAPLLHKQFAQITKQQLRDLLEGFKVDGHPYKAKVTHAWLKKLFRWAAERDYVAASIMEAVRIDIERRERSRVYSDVEIAACWNAASQLSAVESAYVKLLMLLAPRKTALACLRRSHLDNADNPTLWTTPHELTKSKKSSPKKREYKTPLPPLAARILKGVLHMKGLLRSDSDVVFPGLSPTGHQRFFGARLVDRLVARGAPADFAFHTWRHTLATFLENAGHSEWERALVLNHSGSGVTAGYSHGHALDLKRELLCKWAEHVQGLVSPEGAALLR